MSSICSFNKFGFCKFGETCRKRHVQKCCDSIECDILSCENRHPKICRFFITYKRCKFGDFCKYKHEVESSENKVNLEIKIKNLEVALEKNIIEIRKLNYKIECIESATSEGLQRCLYP